MTWQIATSFSAGFFSLFMAFFILRGKIDIIKIIFSLLNLTISTWNFGDILISFSRNTSSALFFDKISYVGAFFIAPFFCFLILVLTNKYKDPLFRKFIIINFCVATIFSILNLSTNWFLKNVKIHPSFVEEIGPLYYAFIFFSLLILIISICILYSAYKKEKLLF